MADPDPIDVEVGGRLRLLRRYRGLSQTELATQLGLTFQQVQKYERGANRISASKLWKAAEVLGVPVAELFAPSDGSLSQSSVLGYLEVPDAAELLLAWSRVESDSQRRAVLALLRTLGG